MSRRTIEDVLPLSPLQEGLYFHNAYDERSLDVYNVQMAFDLEGELDPAALREAAAALLRRHPNLRAAFRHDGLDQPVQLIPSELPLDWSEVDLRAHREPDRAAEVDRLLADDAARRFDLGKPPLLRFTLVRLGERRWLFVLTNHHILFDGWSRPLLMKELLALYRDPAVRLPRTRPFRDYLAWLARQDRAEAEAAWRTTLAGLAEPTLIAPDAPRVPVAPQTVHFVLSIEDTERLVAFARARGLTVNAVVQGAWAIVLSALAGRDDVVFGVTVSGRPAELPDVETMVGLFINTVPLRVVLRQAETRADLLVRVQREQTALLAHHHLGLADIQVAGGHSRLFDTKMVFENYPLDPGGEGAGSEEGVRIVGARSSEGTHYPLDLIAMLPRDRLKFRLDHRPDVVGADEARGVADRLVRVLLAVVDRPDAPVGGIDLLGPDRERVLAAASGARRDMPYRSLPDLFEDQVRRDPHADAVAHGTRRLTYGELNARANRLARVLIREGVSAERFVAIAVERSVEQAVALLAVLKAGGAYLPLDPAHPPARTAGVLAEARPRLVVTTPAVADDLPDTGVPRIVLDDGPGDPAVDPGDVTDAERGGPIDPRQTAYLIYTSGSTGKPKGAVIEHGALSAYLTRAREVYPTLAEGTLVHSPISFDLTVSGLYGALVSGGCARLTELTGHVRGERAAFLKGTPSVLGLLAELPDRVSPARTLMLGGELLLGAPLEAWRARNPGAEVVNVYGATEATVNSTEFRLPPGTPAPRGAVPVGKPFRNTTILLLDSALRPVPQGVPGEAYIAGTGLARGYFARPDLTAGRFVANPYGAPGERMYRTGDVLRPGASGDLEFVGRGDGQVKLRGYRVELGEVEAVLAAHPDVSRAVVVVREDQRLVAYVTTVGDGPLDEEVVRKHAAETLPDYMVPSAVVVLDEFPLTPNGKLDRAALPEPRRTGVVRGRSPRGPREEILCALFAEVLGVPAVGVDDDFFDLGGHSLLATRLVGRIRSTLDVELSIRQLFESRTPSGLAGALDAAASPARRPTAGPRPSRIPLSHAQRRLWFLNRFEDAAPTYNVPTALRLDGPLDRAALSAALNDVVARHEVLRTVFAEDADGPHQVVRPETHIEPAVVGTTDAALPGELAAATRQRFDLAADLPLRAVLFALGPDRHVLLIVMHHIACDAWSLRPLADDLTAAYSARRAGEAPAWAPLPLQYADYAVWLADRFGDPDDPDSLAARQLAYWTTALAGLPEQLDLPADRPRPAVAGHRGDQLDFEVPADVHARLVVLAKDHRASLFMVVQTALAALLSRLGAGEDIPIGTPIAGRTHDDLDPLIGFFINTLVLRTDVSGDPTFAELISRVRQTDLAAYEHQDLPFERLVEVLNPVRSLSRHPLFQVMLAFNNTADHSAGDLRHRTRELEVVGQPVRTGLSRFDLLLFVVDRYGDDGAPAGMSAAFEYSADLFDADTVRRIIDGLLRVLAAVADDPQRRVGSVDVLDPAWARRMTSDWNDTARPVPSASLPDLFAAQVRRTPHRVAVEGDGSLTYAELARRVNRLARHLVARGVGPEDLVALAMPRSVDQVVALLAVVTAGAAYVPVDPDHPEDRIARLLDDAAPALVLTEGDGLFTADGPDHPLTDADRTAPLRPEHPAYAIYTSGSSGTPKAVLMPASAVVNLIAWHRRAVPADPGRVAQFTAVGFDVSVQEVFSAMLHGHTLVVCPEPVRRDASALARWLRDQRIAELYAPNLVIDAVCAAAAEDGTDLPDLTTLAQAGEALALGPAVRAFFARPGKRLHNHYGPTETHAATAHSLPGSVPDWPASAPIGTPVDNAGVYVLDRRLRPVPPGVPGELYVAGAGLARGYLRRPALTAERFVASPFGGRVYRTGDLARWTPGGVLEYLGRADRQVKVRGFRIEPGEVEAALAGHLSVARCVVAVRGARLVAYVVPSGEDVDAAALRAHTASALPDYMVPSAFVTMPSLPLTRNGKLDHAALPAPAPVAGRDVRG
ncbi:amino acid adenylation domain-containing protein, partial [Saccharothrix sp. MB29]|nr:amino acid adenylation domain-containing protein [Saccharothrix sp. MB29]